ncbi:hypothetical protein FOCC_FOCC003474 [Frankliniella occidentalis]|nr:hypothetical protein FOCC_FOCC003474 [Frankliniella occidentalis]
MDGENRIILNVGGIRYETYRTTLKKIPATRLSRLTEALANYDPILNEYFFDRHPGVFAQVLNYYRSVFRTSKSIIQSYFVPFVTTITGQVFFYTRCGVPQDREAALPNQRVWPAVRGGARVLGARLESSGAVLLEHLQHPQRHADDTRHPGQAGHRCGAAVGRGGGPPVRLRGGLPRRQPVGVAAPQAQSVVAVRRALLQHRRQGQNYQITNPTSNRSTVQYAWTLDKERTDPHEAFFYVELACNAWFTFELAVRSVVSPNLVEFIKSPVNVIDFVATLSFYTDVLLRSSVAHRVDKADILEFFSIIRILRLFKLTRHSPGLKILVHTFQASAKELTLLVFFLVLGIVVFASLVYYAERLQARSKLPKRRRRVLPVEQPRRQPRIEGGPGGPGGGGGGGLSNRRMNAIKHHPANAIFKDAFAPAKIGGQRERRQHDRAGAPGAVAAGAAGGAAHRLRGHDGHAAAAARPAGAHRYVVVSSAGQKQLQPADSGRVWSAQ